MQHKNPATAVGFLPGGLTTGCGTAGTTVLALRKWEVSLPVMRAAHTIRVSLEKECVTLCLRHTNCLCGGFLCLGSVASAIVWPRGFSVHHGSRVGTTASDCEKICRWHLHCVLYWHVPLTDGGEGGQPGPVLVCEPPPSPAPHKTLGFQGLLGSQFGRGMLQFYILSEARNKFTVSLFKQLPSLLSELARYSRV